MKERLSNPAQAAHTLPGKVYLIGAGPGDPGLITLRAVECLQNAQVVVFDRLANRSLLQYAPQAEWIDVGKQPDHHPVPQDQINRILVDQARNGRMVARLKGGDPFVFGRGGEEALALVEAGIPFEVVPGVTSAVAVPAYAGIPVTQRGLAGSLTIIAGHRSMPETDVASWSPADLRADTLVFLMGVQNLPAIVDALLESGRPANTPVALIQQGTLPAQKVVTGTLADILQHSDSIQSPAITVVGEVVRLRDQLAWFEANAARPLLGLRILSTRPFESGPALTQRLAQLGAEVLEAPAFRVIPAEDTTELDHQIHALAGRGHLDWILFTSVHAVTFFFQRVLGLGYDLRILAHCGLGAVGEATARALTAFHLKADFIPSTYRGLDWVAQVGDLAGKRVLLPRSAIAPSDVPEALQRSGATVEAPVAYSVAPMDTGDEIVQALSHSGIDWITFFSPSAVRSLLDSLSKTFGYQQALAILKKSRIACIGPTTAAEVDRIGLQADLIAEEYTVDGLVEALVKWRARL